LKATVGLLNEEGEAAAAAADEEQVVDTTEVPRVGMSLRPLSQSSRAEFGIAEDVEGVLVSEVADGGPAAEKGVRPGDVIVEVGQEAVRTPSEVEEQVAKAADAGRKSVLFLIHSGGDLRFVPLALADNG
jgi:serine protease Do